MALDFGKIRARAAKRKGGEEVLQSLLPYKTGVAKDFTDDRALSLMTKCIFRAGFVWKVIEQKWPGFEDGFLGFDPAKLVHQPEEFWDALTQNKAVVRNGPKIMAVHENAVFVQEIAKEHVSFRDFLNNWPADDLTGLWNLLSKRGTRLGGMTGKYFTRFAGKDCWIPSGDVVACLRDAGLEIAEKPTSKGDLKKIEAVFNEWTTETGLSHSALSRICAMSIGDNYDADYIREARETLEE